MGYYTAYPRKWMTSVDCCFCEEPNTVWRGVLNFVCEHCGCMVWLRGVR